MVIPVDIHICGACRKQFSDVEEFIEHKKTDCSIILSVQQSGFQSSELHPEVRSDAVSAGSQVLQTGINRFTIPLPSVHIQETSGDQQSHEDIQNREAEVQHQMQHVSGIEKLQARHYGHMTGNEIQINQTVEYGELASDSEVHQQPIGHEYVKTHFRRNKPAQDQSLEQPGSTPLVETDRNDEVCSEDILSGPQIGSQYETVQQDYILQQVSQTEEVYEDKLVESQSMPPEPVYTLETHEEPSMYKSVSLIQENLLEPSGDGGTETEVIISMDEANSKENEVTSAVTHENEASVTFSQPDNGKGGKVFQQAVSISASQTYANNDNDTRMRQNPLALSESSSSRTVFRQGETLQPVGDFSQAQLTTSEKADHRQHTWTRIVNKPVEGRETDIQQEKSPTKGNNKDLKSSQPKAPPEKKYVCNHEECTYRSAYMKDLERHYRTHTGEKPFCCNQCGKSFNRNDKLILHMRYHAGEKSFKCQLCDYSCVESGSLKKHVRVHTEDRPFKCQVCPYSSRSSGQLQIHLRTHTGDKPYVCVRCSATFKVTSDLKRHMRVHTGEKPYSCDQCDYKCSVKGNLKSHMRVNHSSRHEMKCHTCDFKSSSKKVLREHLKLHDVNDELTCSVCNYQCASKSALKNHMLRHNNEESLIKCNYCDYKTRQSGNVVAHIKRKHPSRVPYRKKIGRLYRKQNKGGEENPDILTSSNGDPSSKIRARCKKLYKCNLCDNSFVREDSLKCHVKQHRDLSKSCLSTAYAVLKLQQPVLNMNIQQDDNPTSNEMFDPSQPYIPTVARAETQMQPLSDNSSRIVQSQDETSQGEGQTPNLGIKDILAAAGINNNVSGDAGPGKSSSAVVTVNGDTAEAKHTSPGKTAEMVTNNLLPSFTITQNPQDVPTVQVMQNISLPYIRLPDGQILVIGQGSMGEVPVSPRKTMDSAQITHSEQVYPVTLQQVQLPSLPVAQQVSLPVPASQSGAIPIQIILPNESQHNLPLVTQLLNSSLSTGQSLSNKHGNQQDPIETPQNYFVHIPGNPGNLIKTSGASTDGHSQSYVLQIPGTGTNYGLNASELQQSLVSHASGRVVQQVKDMS